MKEFKTIESIIPSDVEGKVEAVFSVFNTIDSDNDVVVPKSIRSGYGEKGVTMVWAHDWAKPIGRGKIIQDDNNAKFVGEFNMNTDAGKEAYETVKAMGDLQQWSFGFEVLDSEVGTFTKDSGESQEVRYLKDVKVWEVSPVLVGANQETYTMAIKANKEKAQSKDVKEQVRTDEYTTLDEARNRAEELECSGTHTHEDENGNLTYMPCSTHNEYEMAKSKEVSTGSGQTFVEEVETSLNDVFTVLTRAKELTALRLEKDKKLSPSSADALMELQEKLNAIFQDIDDLLNAGLSEEVKDNRVKANEVFADTMRILAETSEI